jgi:potassium efflux system protein
VFAFRAIGVGWNNVQWMAAAMTVGLGFGLQEIFANFISGLIILFERPMRIGDTVTVGGVSGTVSRIRSRATIITDGDRKELIVPNKEFITGQLVNWTLSDTVIRIGVRVIVAGGSDPALVTRLLLQSANEHPLVLRDPAPVALLSEFGENGMRFDLSVFVGSLDKIVPVKHELHMKIGERLHAANIEFGNQQMDLRMREIPAWLSTPTLRVASKQAAG